MKTLLLASAFAVLASVVSVPAGAVTYNFNLSGSGYGQDTVVPGDLFASTGLTLSSPDGLVTACNGRCLSAGAGAYTGVITGVFDGTTNNITFSEVNGNGVVSLYDATGNFIEVLSPGSTYSGATPVQSFTDSLGYDGLYSIIANDVSAVPEPASLVLLSAGLAGVGMLRRRSAP